MGVPLTFPGIPKPLFGELVISPCCCQMDYVNRGEDTDEVETVTIRNLPGYCCLFTDSEVVITKALALSESQIPECGTTFMSDKGLGLRKFKILLLAPTL